MTENVLRAWKVHKKGRIWREVKAEMVGLHNDKKGDDARSELRTTFGVAQGENIT